MPNGSNSARHSVASGTNGSITLSFDAYLKQKNWKSRWRHITGRYADYLIAGAKTAKELAAENNCSDLPNEAIAREVRKLPKAEQTVVWRKVE